VVIPCVIPCRYVYLLIVFLFDAQCDDFSYA
jgi:hypothetical protein